MSKLNKHTRSNFDTLVRAARAGDLALMDARETATGKSVPLICAVSRDGGEYVFTPFAVMIEDNPV